MYNVESEKILKHKMNAFPILQYKINIYVTYSSTAVQSQKAVSAYFTSKQILPFGFAEQSSSQYSGFVYFRIGEKVDFPPTVHKRYIP